MPIGAWDTAETSGAWEQWADPHHPTAAPSGLTWGVAHTDVHRRMGIVMGIVHHGDKYLWKLQWKYLTEAEILVIRDWWTSRLFQFSPAYNTVTPSSSTWYDVLWREKEFKPVPQRGCMYALTATLEEI
jgi:hypothetical protein